MNIGPLVFEPIYKPRIWGGQRIFTHFSRPSTTLEPIGESWELADLEEDQSLVRVGPFRGHTVGELRANLETQLMGRVPLFEGRFPLLIKFLDAQTALSVQVHPTEAVARKMGGQVRVKHEAWYILAAGPDGLIYHGLEPGVSPEAFREAMMTGRVDGILRKVPVRAGQCHYLPSGTVHALGKGVLVAEVQTPSDVTYRTYDWGRIDPSTGKPRALHLEQAMECIVFGDPQPSSLQPVRELAAGEVRIHRLTVCDSFVIDRVEMAARSRRRVTGGQPIVWIVLEGGGQIDGIEPTGFVKGNVILLPADMTATEARADSPTTCLEVTIPH